MRIFRRVIMPVAWLGVFAVIAVALVKIAFVDGLDSEPALAGPAASVSTPAIQATRATVTNRVEIDATVQGDADEQIRSTVAGTVNYLFLQPGAAVRNGDPLFQVKTEIQPESGTTTSNAPTGDAPEGAGQESRTPAVPQPTYTYTNVLAESSGTLKTLTVLLDQQISVGEVSGSVDPGTFTVSGTVDAAQQYRLLAKPGSAEINVTGGPGPFTCSEPVLTSATSTEETGSAGASVGGGGVGRSVPAAIVPAPGGGSAGGGGPATGKLSCPVPADVSVFAGLGASMTVTAGESANVITLPLTAVQGTVTEGIVFLASDPAPDPSAPNGAGGSEGNPPGAADPEQRTVQLGLNDGTVVEIVSGLDEGDYVLEFIPGAPGQPDINNPGAYPMGG